MFRGKRSEFRTLLHECVTDSLSYFIGNRTLHLFFIYLKRVYSIEEGDVACHIDDFDKVLNDFFGIEGGRAIKLDIEKRLCERIGFNNVSRKGFVEFIIEAEKYYNARETASQSNASKNS